MMKPTEHGKSVINPRRLPPARVAKRKGSRRYKRQILNDESSLRAKFRNRTSATTNDPFITYTYTFLGLSKLISRAQLWSIVGLENPYTYTYTFLELSEEIWRAQPWSIFGLKNRQDWKIPQAYRAQLWCSSSSWPGIPISPSYTFWSPLSSFWVSAFRWLLLCSVLATLLLLLTAGGGDCLYV